MNTKWTSKTLDRASSLLSEIERHVVELESLVIVRKAWRRYFRGESMLVRSAWIDLRAWNAAVSTVVSKNGIACVLLAVLAVLTWTAPPGVVDGYRMYRAASLTAPFELVGTVAGNVTTFTDLAGVAGNCWRVSGFNAAGEGLASNNACLLQVILGAPGLGVKP
jgi:hypothetical protein